MTNGSNHNDSDNNEQATQVRAEKKAKRALTEDSLAQAVIQNAFIGIITIDEKGVIRSFNLAAEQLFGYDAEEAIGQNVSILVPEPHREQHDRYIENYLRTGHAKIIGLGREVSARRKDGTTFPAELKVSEIWVKKERFFTGFVRDLTEEKRSAEIIARQQQEMLELSTPVIRIWDGILALPLIGTLDSARTQIVMENLLEEIVRTEADVAILDISGVPAVDTMVAQHLLKTISAARLMGAKCIISGIRPEIAQTIVHLGIDLSDIETRSTMSEALKLALGMLNQQVSRTGSNRRN